MKRVAVIFIFFLSLTTSSFGDTIYLKNGRRVVGKIVARLQNSIKIDVEGIKLIYPLDEVERVEQEAVQTMTAQAYVQKMNKICAAAKIIFDKRLTLDGKVVSFVSKNEDKITWKMILSYYEEAAKDLESVEKELLSVNPPAEYIKTHELMRDAFSYRIVGYKKAAESLEKNRMGIMDYEAEPLLYKSKDLWLEALQSFEKTKEKQGNL